MSLQFSGSGGRFWLRRALYVASVCEAGASKTMALPGWSLVTRGAEYRAEMVGGLVARFIAVGSGEGLR